MRVPFRFWLDPSILKRSHQKMGLRGLTGLKERKHVCTTISDMDDCGLGGKVSQARHLAHPHIRFPFISLPSFAPRLADRSWLAYKGFLHCTAQHLATVWQNGQYRLQIQPSSSLIADLAQALCFGMMAQVHLGGVLDQ
jgi:hypothetical protein